MPLTGVFDQPLCHRSIFSAVYFMISYLYSFICCHVTRAMLCTSILLMLSVHVTGPSLWSFLFVCLFVSSPSLLKSLANAPQRLNCNCHFLLNSFATAGFFFMVNLLVSLSERPTQKLTGWEDLHL